MRIGCLCVTERRSHLVGLSIASFLEQDHPDKQILVVYVPDLESKYDYVVRGFADSVISTMPVLRHRLKSVCERLDAGCAVLQEKGCEAIATWDDDDWKHPTYLGELSRYFEANPKKYFTGYLWGMYVNARHLWAEDLSQKKIKPWGYWGASLAYRTDAWAQRLFAGTPFPGYDPYFCKSFDRVFWGEPIDDDPYKMLSFCHGQNVYQHCRGGGFDLKPWIEKNVPELSRREMFRIRDWYEERNIEPPQLSRSY